MEIQLSLTHDECETVLQLIGAQPTSTGLYPLGVKIKTQAEAAIAAQVAEAEEAKETA